MDLDWEIMKEFFLGTLPNWNRKIECQFPKGKKHWYHETLRRIRRRERPGRYHCLY